MSRDYTLFYYWDNVDGRPLPDYLLLCLETWQKNAQAHKIIRVGSDNIEYFSEGLLTAQQMSLFSPAQRSDAATAVIMNLKRGLFIDADTILLPSFNADKYLCLGKPSVYANMNNDYPQISNAFLAAPSANVAFMKKWSDEVLRRVAYENNSFVRKIRREIRTALGKRNHVKWDYLGTSILEELLKEADAPFAFHNAKESGYLPFTDNYTAETVNSYWLDTDPKATFTPIEYPDGIIALQNSWLPEYIKNMSKSEILNHPSRLGRLLAHAYMHA